MQAKTESLQEKKAIVPGSPPLSASCLLASASALSDQRPATSDPAPSPQQLQVQWQWQWDWKWKWKWKWKVNEVNQVP
jgi:hypothetical protein